MTLIDSLHKILVIGWHTVLHASHTNSKADSNPLNAACRVTGSLA